MVIGCVAVGADSISEVRWENDNIVVMDEVTIVPPYTVNSCSARDPSSAALQHVRKLVSIIDTSIFTSFHCVYNVIVVLEFIARFYPICFSFYGRVNLLRQIRCSHLTYSFVVAISSRHATRKRCAINVQCQWRSNKLADYIGWAIALSIPTALLPPKFKV